MKQFLLFSTLLVLSLTITHNAYCVPVHNKPITIQQNDGTTITIMLHGDEWLHWTTTTDNYRIVKNNNGIYEYAKLADNKIEASGIKASNPNSRTSEELQHITTLEKNIGTTGNKLKSSKQRNIKPILKSTAADNGFPNIGENKYLVILVNFSDRSTTYTQSQFNNYMNEVGYNGTGSFRDFYLENSNNKLDITTTVTAWVTLPETHDYYADKNGSFALDAVKAAHAAGVDFSEFDNNNDDWVDGVAIIHQGEGHETSGDETDIHSHSYDIYSALYFENDETRPNESDILFDGVYVNSYTTQPEESFGSMNSIGVICHEFGHALGALDYYDTDYEENGQYEGTGKWDLMADGSYNGQPLGSTPAHMNCFEKQLRGWITSETLETSGEITLAPSINSNHIYRIDTNTPYEYFLLENKIQTGFDSHLPGEGMLIYHVDENHIVNNTGSVNAGSHQGMYPKVASNIAAQINTTQCPFPGTANNTDFTDDSTPNAKDWNGTITIKPITEITKVGDDITFTFNNNSNKVVFTVKTKNIPLVDANISFLNSNIKTDANGQANFGAPLGETLSYTVSKKDYEPVTGDITIKSTTNNIEVNLATIESGVTSLKAGNIKVYPNPATNGHFTVALPVNVAKYKVYNTTSKLIAMGSFTSLTSELLLPNNTAGIYILQIEMDNKIYTGRLVIK